MHLAVSDTGQGISPADARAALHAVRPARALRARAIEGTGLGLALSKRLVEAMDGSLVVESRRGVGTTFTVELPSAEAPWAVSVGPEDDGGRHRRRRGPAARCSTSKTTWRTSASSSASSARRPELTLISAMQGRQGLELARSHRPQAIILDLHLPDMSGGEVLARLREDPERASIPVVILSADATPGQIDAAARAGRSRLSDQAARRRRSPRVPRQPLRGTGKPCRMK